MEAGSIASTVQCTFLDASTPCGPQFNGYPVLSQYFPTVQDFSTSMANYIGDTEQVTESLMRTSGCVSGPLVREAVNGLRYQTSVWCASIVHDAIAGGCQAPTTPDPIRISSHLLCPNECSLASSTLYGILGNETVCPRTSADEEQLNRVVTLDKIRGFCDLVQNSSSSTGATNFTCFNGISSESQFCGWKDSRTALSQCNSGTMMSDPCCQRLLSNPTVLSSANQTTPINTTQPIASTNNSNTSSQSTMNGTMANNHSADIDPNERLPSWASPGNQTKNKDSSSGGNKPPDTKGKDSGDPKSNSSSSSYSSYPQAGAAAVSIPVWIPVFLTVLILFSAIPVSLFVFGKFSKNRNHNDHETGHE